MTLKIACVCVQGDGDEGRDPDQRSAQSPALLQEGFLLHHAGRHAAAAPHRARGHDGTLSDTVLSLVLHPFIPADKIQHITNSK